LVHDHFHDDEVDFSAVRGSGAALATVVEVPVMLSVCLACNRTRHWFVLKQA
jgi:ACR3 family arsenite efflux pump ArsB